MVPSVKGQWEASIDTLDPGSRQIAAEEGRDGLAGLCDLVVVVVVRPVLARKKGRKMRRERERHNVRTYSKKLLANRQNLPNI